jgi:hypothetical protein
VKKVKKIKKDGKKGRAVICAKCLLCPEDCYICDYLEEEPHWHCNIQKLLRAFEKIKDLKKIKKGENNK